MGQTTKPTPEQIKRAMEIAKKIKAQGGLKGKDAEELAEEAKKIMKPLGKTVLSIPKKISKPFPKIVLTAIQRKALKGEDLKKYIISLNALILNSMDSSTKKLVQEILADADLDNKSLFELGMYSYLNGALQEGSILVGTSLTRDISNDFNANSYAGILINANWSAQAMPICRGLLSSYPENDLVLNNIGQAFIGIGEQDSAMVYLRKCLKQNPSHPQANNTAALISKEKGQKEKAVEYAKKAVENGLIDGSMDIIEEFDKSGTAYDFFAKPKDLPDYFNIFKIKKPMHQKRVEDEQLVKAERAAFKSEIDRMRGELSEIIRKEQELGTKQLNERIQDLQKRLFAGEKLDVNLGNPWFKKAGRIFSNKYIQVDVLKAMMREEEQYTAKIAELENEYDRNESKIYKDFAEKKAQYVCNGEGTSSGCINLERLAAEECKAIKELRNRFLVNCATVAESYDDKQIHWAAERFFFQSKWGYLLGPNEHLANVNYYKYADEYLKNISKIMTNYKPKAPACENLEAELKKFTFAEITAPKCPINETINLGLIALKSNCKETSITLSGKKNSSLEKYKIQFKQNHQKAQNSLAIIYVVRKDEVKLSEPIKKFMKADVGVKVELTVQGFLSWSKDNVWDAGAKGMATTSIWAFDTLSGHGGNMEATAEIGYSYQAGLNGDAKLLNGFLAPTAASLPEFNYKP